MASGIAGLERAGYVHCGDLGLTDREVFTVSRYSVGKSSVLQDILALSDLTEQEKLADFRFVTPG